MNGLGVLFLLRFSIKTSFNQQKKSSESIHPLVDLPKAASGWKTIDLVEQCGPWDVKLPGNASNAGTTLDFMQCLLHVVVFDLHRSFLHCTEKHKEKTCVRYRKGDRQTDK